jgi:hypothetical protein
MSEQSRIEVIIKTIGKIYVSFEQKPTEQNFAIWEEALEDLTIEQIIIGGKKTLKEWESPFMPRPAQFIAMCKGGEGNLTNEDQASDAWEAVANAVRRFGYTKSICFTDKAATQAILNIGGWVNLCKTLTTESTPFIRKEFVKSYSSKVNVSWDSSPFLIGMFGFNENSLAFVGVKNNEECQVLIDHHNQVNKSFSELIEDQKRRP